MKNNDLVCEWVKRSKSSLERAKHGRFSDEILFEDLCFDCQQAAEKAIKALLIDQNIHFPPTHSLNLLLELLKSKNISYPSEMDQVVTLNEYAVETRYPGDYEPVTEKEYKEALAIAEKYVMWIIDRINNNKKDK